MEHFGNYLINRVRKTNLNGVPPCIGCSNEEIENLMKDQGVSRLPRFYREYLEVMGKSGLMNIHAGSDWSCNRLLKIKQDWQNDLKEVKIDFVIPEKSFVFFQHGGYEYRYFMTDHDNDDCPTYLYLEDNSEQGYKVNFTHRWLKPTAICQHRHKVDSFRVVGFLVCFVLSTITLIIMFVLADGMDAIPTGNLNF